MKIQHWRYVSSAHREEYLWMRMRAVSALVVDGLSGELSDGSLVGSRISVNGQSRSKRLRQEEVRQWSATQVI